MRGRDARDAELVAPRRRDGDGPTCRQGDTLVVVGRRSRGQRPRSRRPGHYCFVGLIGPRAGSGAAAAGSPDWNGFIAFIRNENNVTWRNFNVVDELPDPSGDPSVLPFLIAGAPDEARVFDLQILRDLPRAARVRLQVPFGLAAKLRRGRLWKMEVDRKQRFAVFDLPPLPRIDLGAIRLGAGARYPRV